MELTRDAVEFRPAEPVAGVTGAAAAGQEVTR
jgi:hypothetical protein